MTKAASPLGTLRISAGLDEALSRLAEKTGRSKAYHARKALARYIEDTEDYLLAIASLKEGGKSISLEELKRQLGLED